MLKASPEHNTPHPPPTPQQTRSFKFKSPALWPHCVPSERHDRWSEGQVVFIQSDKTDCPVHFKHYTSLSASHSNTIYKDLWGRGGGGNEENMVVGIGGRFEITFEDIWIFPSFRKCGSTLSGKHAWISLHFREMSKKIPPKIRTANFPIASSRYKGKE